MLYWVIIPVVLILAILLIVMVLLQPSKSGGVGGAFGNIGASLGSTFGSRRTLDFLAKGTTWVAAALGLICIIANAFVIGPDATDTTNPITTGANATAPAAPKTVMPNGGAAQTPGAGAPAPPAGGAQQAPGTQQTTPGNNAQPAPAGGTKAPVQVGTPDVKAQPVDPSKAPAPKQ